MRRLVLAVALVVALSTTTPATGHGTLIPHDLAGVTLCVDDETLSVAFERDPSGAVDAMVVERLTRALHTTFDAAGLPWRRTDVCPAGRGYLEVTLHVRDATWFAPRAAAYDVAVRVGWRDAGGARVRADPPDAFDFRAEELYDEAAVGVPAFVFLPRYVEAGLRDLSVSWWEDREAASVPPRWLPWLGLALALVVGALTRVLVRRRQARATGVPATASRPARAYHRV